MDAEGAAVGAARDKGLGLIVPRGRRFVKLPPTRRDPAGKPLCRWCGAAVPKGRQEWCSKTCVDDYNVRASQAGARRYLKQRDGGVCRICRLDTVRLHRILRQLHRRRDRSPRQLARWQQAEAVATLWFGRPYDLTLRHGPWEADHIHPLVLGGDPGPANLRTLCRRCHRCVTAVLRRELAHQRAR